MTITPAASPAAPQTAHQDTPAKVHDAAQQFEALLLGEMLKTVRQGSSSFLGAGEDQAGSMAMDVAMEQFAGALAAQGGLGLSGLVAKGLTREPDAATASNPPSHTP